MRPAVRRVACALPAGLVGMVPPVACLAAPPGVPASGIVVEEVTPGSVLDLAGFAADDVLLAWERLPGPPANPEGAHGEFESVFHWIWLKVEEAPRGPVRILGERRGQPVVFEVPAGSWNRKDAEVRGRLSGDAFEDYLRGRERIDAGEVEAGVRLWEKVAGRWSERGEELLASWIHLEAAAAWSRAGEAERAEAVYRAALEATREPLGRAVLWTSLGTSYRLRSEYARAEESFRSALQLYRARSEDLGVARSLYQLGVLRRHQGLMPPAEDYGRQALALEEEQAPGSLPLAATLSHLGIVYASQTDFDRAEEHVRRALEIEEALAPDSLGVALHLNNLGGIELGRGNLDLAQHYYGRSVEIKERFDPESYITAGGLNNLGIVAANRGHLSLAEGYYERALEIQRRVVPGSVHVARILSNLSTVTALRGDLVRAREYAQQALSLQEARSPGSLDVALTLQNLGVVALDLGEPERAREHHEKAIDVLSEVAPGSLEIAQNLSNLGNVALARGELEQAEGHLLRALAIQKSRAPGRLDVAETLDTLGLVALGQARPERAVDYHREALEIRARLAPESRQEAESWYHLGLVHRSRGRSDQAAGAFLSSIAALDAQARRLGGSQDVRSRFHAHFGDYYRAALEVLLELERPGEAFAVLERSRARSFLAMLAERDLVFSADLPEELERERRRLAARYDRVRREISELTPERAPRLEELLGELAGLRLERDDFSAKVRRAAPRLAELRDPRPADLSGARKALDPGTVMLSYSVGRSAAFLFVLTREGVFDVHTLPVAEEELRREVRLFRWLIGETRPDAPLAPNQLAAVEKAGRRLYRILIEPAEARLVTAERVLIVPDGPLHSLPFAALVREAEGGAGGPGRRYLVEWKPLHSVLSASVYAELRRRREKRGGGGDAIRLTAFGDPRLPRHLPAAAQRGTVAAVRFRSAFGRELGFTSLPSTRREVEGIAALYPPAATEVYLGAEATEERAKAGGRGAVLHFATHGWMDPDFPLDSGLVLSVPEELGAGRDNGLLQAWEILESVRLDVDLVVLSGCATGLGQERAGEGLMGLNRAFQYAGAPTVVSTLWSVADQATAELMVRFYRHLRAGLPKDAALRAAQLALISKPLRVADEQGRTEEIDASAPFFWAAFQITGDWR